MSQGQTVHSMALAYHQVSAIVSIFVCETYNKSQRLNTVNVGHFMDCVEFSI
jgi:hypothetical protein